MLPPSGCDTSPADPIDAAYAALAQAPEFTRRAQQEELSRQVFMALVEDVPLLAEAPTGTGKTLAYLIGAIAAHRFLNDGRPIVIATATVTLQEQVMRSDLVKLQAANIIAPGEVALLKGRGRYFCPLLAEKSIHGDRVLQFDLFDKNTKQPVFAGDAADLLNEWQTNSWDGDKDQLKRAVPPGWESISSNQGTCIRASCPHFKNCPFFSARADAIKDGVKVYVTNQDYVLTDLELARKSGSVLSSTGYLLVVDEAHHFPSKARSLDESAFFPEYLPQLLGDVSGMLPRLISSPKIEQALAAANLTRTLLPRQLLLAKRNAMLINSGLKAWGGTQVQRFKALHTLPQACGNALVELLPQLTAIHTFIEKSAEGIQKRLSYRANKSFGGAGGLELGAHEIVLLQKLSTLRFALEHEKTALSKVLSEASSVRWYEYSDDRGAVLAASPLEGAEWLSYRLWGAPSKISPVFVSATLRTNRTFARYRERVGAPEKSREFVMQSTFNYAASYLCIPPMDYEPGRRDSEGAYLAEVVKKLLVDIDPSEGTLILFNSREWLQHTYARLKPYFPKVLGQDIDGSAEQAAQRHRELMDAGPAGSILLGTKKMGEGLDLPGKYCTHVILTRLPFDVPDHPVEQERKERYEAAGRDWFIESVIPDVSEELQQMVGRLLRRETDWGRITVYDRRLLTKRYGGALLADLPEFSRLFGQAALRVPEFRRSA